MTFRMRVLALFLGFALLAGACGDDGDADTADAGADDTVAADAGDDTVAADAGDDTVAADAGDDAAADAGDDAPAEMETVTVRIGYLGEFSGPAGFIGQVTKQGMDIAIADVNAAGIVVDGQILQFELVIADNETDPGAAVVGATELVEDEGVRIVFGPGLSSIATGVAQTILPQDVMMISAALGLQELLTPEAIDGGESRLLFRSNVSPDGFSQSVGFAIQEFLPDIETIAIVQPDNPTGEVGSVPWIVNAEALGIEVVANLRFPGDALDFQTVLTEVKAEEPDVIVFGSFPAQITGLMRQSHELGIDAVFATANMPFSIALVDAIGEPLPNPVISLYQPATIDRLPDGTVFAGRDGVLEVAARMEAAGHEVTGQHSNAFYLYDYIALLAEGMRVAGTTEDLDAIAAALEGGASIEGALGPLSWGPGHVPTMSMEACQLIAGEIECVVLPPVSG